MTIDNYLSAFLFTLLFTSAISSVPAQVTLEEYIGACPEMEVGKPYTGEDIRAVKKRYRGTHVFQYQLKEQYPFAKISKGNYVHLLVFDQEFNGKLIHLHAYVYDTRTYEKVHASSYIYRDGQDLSGTQCQATITLSKKGKITAEQRENGQLKTHIYTPGKKKFEYGG